MRPFEGIYTPLLTFFDARGEVNMEAQIRHVANLIKAGVDGVIPMASMGEFTAMDRKERAKMAEAIVEEVSGRAQVVVGTGAPSTRQAIELSRDAEKSGADSVMVIHPFYIRPDRVGIRRHYEAIREAVDIPVMAYNLPFFTGVDIPSELILDLARDGTIDGLKDSSGDLAKALHIISELPETVSFLTGSDPLLTAVVLHGGQGGVLGSSNIFPKKVVQLYDLIRAGRTEEATKLQLDLARFSRALKVGTYPAAAKYLVKRVWGTEAHSRPPVHPLTDEERQKVDEIMAPLLE
ncbi:MAG: dihydrodipicolinate synthase family protein [Thermoplasmata archaeon]